MEKFKQKMIHRFVEYGKRHRKLTVPVIVALTVCLAFYYALRGFLQKLRQSRFRRQLACVMLVAIILLTQTDLLSVLASVEGNGSREQTVLGFEELPDEVLNQMVPVGTALEELTLPMELTVFVTVEENTKTEESTEEESGADETEGDSASEGTEESGADETEGDSASESTEESGADETEGDSASEETEESAGMPQEGVAEEGAAEEKAEGIVEGDTENGLEPEESEAEDVVEDTENTEDEQNADTEAADEATVKTVTVELPEYHAEPGAQTAAVLHSNKDSERAPNQTVSISVTWKSIPEYDENTAGEYAFTPILPEGYALAEGVSLPRIAVTVRESFDNPVEGEDTDRHASLHARRSVPAHSHDGVSFDTILTADGGTLSDGNYCLDSDIKLNNNVTISGTVNLCLNGHAITHNAGDGNLFSVYGALNIYDCKDGGTGGIYTSTAENAIMLPGGTGQCTVNLYGGKIQAEQNAIFLQSGCSLNIYGGSVESTGKNAVTGYGNVTLDGGIITGNSGMYCDGTSTKVHLIRGVVRGTGNGSFDSGIYMAGSLIIEDGVTVESTNKYGICLASSQSAVTLKGQPRISGKSGQLYVFSRKEVSQAAELHLDSYTGSNLTIVPNYYSNNYFLLRCSADITDKLTLDNNMCELRYDSSAGGIRMHGHSFTYSADSAVITESCDCGHSATAELTVQSEESLVYTGSPITPCEVVYSDGWLGGSLKVFYSGNTNAGRATAEITKGGAAATLQFTIQRASMSSEVSAAGHTGVYDGNAHGITVNMPTGATVKYGTSADGCTSMFGLTYTDAGRYEVFYEVSKANYESVTGSAFVSISRKTLTDGMVSGLSASYEWLGSAVTPSATVKDGSVTLVKGTDYMVSYSNNTAVGTATMTITGLGNYAGSVEKTFSICKKWKVILNGSGGDGTELTSYVQGIGAILPTDWTKTGYVFAGWYDNENYTGTAVTSIFDTDTGDKEYWAKWTNNVKVIFVADGETYKEVFVDYGGTLADVPPVPQKKYAGEQLYAGKWCMDEQGSTPAVFTDIMADMTIYAVYTKEYTVTLQGGTGYTLSAEAGSVSPVKEGGNFTFCFALQEGYRCTEGSFAVKVNGVKVELAANGTYAIVDVKANQTVTVEGVEKRPDAKPSDGGDKGNDPTPAPQPPAQPQPADLPQRMPQPPSSTNLPEQSRSADASESQPEDEQELEGTGTSEPTEKPFETEKEQQPEGDEEQTVPASIDNGRIVISGEPVATGNVEGMTDTSMVLKLGNGAVIVTVVCAEQEHTAGVADAIAVANAVLTPEQLELISNGKTIEILIDVKDISNQVPKQDKETIENGIKEYQKEVQGLTLGMYVDISMFIRIGEGDWNAITATREPIEIIIGVPEELQETGRTYYIIRSHEGECTFMSDRDDELGTITVGTDRFSSYAIAYVQTEEKRDKCSLCHICPTFLGMCCFIWLATISLTILAIWIIIRRKCKEQ